MHELLSESKMVPTPHFELVSVGIVISSSDTLESTFDLDSITSSMVSSEEYFSKYYQKSLDYMRHQLLSKSKQEYQQGWEFLIH